jgi:PHD/YefM family antitoxin component YafN of YafNO toxin-antitoxin module
MKKNTTLSITNARKEIFDIAKDIDSTKSIYTLTEHGKPIVVMLAADTFESWEKTLSLSSALPNLETDMAEAESQVKANQYISLASLFAEQGFLVQDASQHVYVPHRSVKKSKARRKKNTR